MSSFISKLCLGTVQFGVDYGISNNLGKTSPNEVRKILDYAKKSGINSIDTAYSYGESEKILGESDISAFEVISKYPEINENFGCNNYLSSSLDNLRSKNIYGYIAHNPKVLFNYPKAWDFFKEKKDEGIIKKIGFSLYTPQELDKLLEMGFIPDLIQIPYNIIDRRFEYFFEDLKKLNVEIHARSAFMQGLFFIDNNSLNSFFDPIKNILSEFDRICKSSEEKISVLLNFSLHNNYIKKVVIGINNLTQLIQNINLIEDNFLLPNTLIKIGDNIPEEVLLPYKWPK